MVKSTKVNIELGKKNAKNDIERDSVFCKTIKSIKNIDKLSRHMIKRDMTYILT